MVILAIDVGLASSGFAVLKNKKVLKYGLLTTCSRDEISQRLKKIYLEIKKIVKKYKPNIIVIEKMYLHKFTKTLIYTSYVIAIIFLLSSILKIPVVQYNPKEVKLAITGYGNASKQQIKDMLKKLYRISPFPKNSNVTDALAVGFCHFQSYKLKNDFIFKRFH